MQKYLWGVAEVPLVPGGGAEGSGRRSAHVRRPRGRPMLLMPTPADQNYTGYAKESEGRDLRGARWKGAVDATNDQVLKDGNGKYVVTYYSSSMGGHTEDVRYVGWSDGDPLPERRRRLAVGDGVRQQADEPIVGEGLHREDRGGEARLR